MSEMIDFSSALQRAFDLGDKAATAQYEAQNRPNIIEHDGAAYLYFNGKLTQIEPAEIYHPETFYASTLEGLCDYIQADSDEQFVTGQPAPLVVVESPVRVNVYGVIVGEKKERPLLASCEYEAPEIAIGQYIDAESLFINIQSCFVADENRDLVCKVVNNMTEEQSVQTADDGISQRVILKAGVQEVDKTIFRNPAFLRPIRTFTEVMQPQSPFVVRFKEGRKAALFEADGGAWKREAIGLIGAYLKARLQCCRYCVRLHGEGQGLSPRLFGDSMGAIKVYDGVNDRQLRMAAVEANVSKAEVLGCLIALWLWGLENADSSGLVERCDRTEIVQCLSTVSGKSKEVSEALFAARFVSETENGIVLADWEEQQGWHYREEANRKRNTERKREVRAAQKNSQEKVVQELPMISTGTQAESAPKKPVKKHYADFVLLTAEDYEKIVDKYGEELAAAAIQILNQYIGSTGKKYKSHYMTLIGWPIREAMKRNPSLYAKHQQEKEGKGGGNPYATDMQEWE